MPYKAENWHTLSHEQYFMKHGFLDICRCAFNISRRLVSMEVIISNLNGNDVLEPSKRKESVAFFFKINQNKVKGPFFLERGPFCYAV